MRRPLRILPPPPPRPPGLPIFGFACQFAAILAAVAIVIKWGIRP